MVNAWSLLYEELNETMDETYPVKNYKPNDDIVVGLSTASEGSGWVDTVQYDSISIDTSNFDPYPTIGSLVDDTISIDSVYQHHYPTTPSIEKKTVCNKYEEDKSLKAVRDYVSSTYNGHYTSKANNVQTLDLIESVGDAESFCRSNAIKYLSRYDKRGQAKRDILKAMHYCLLLYYFSGNTKDETETRGYETF